MYQKNKTLKTFTSKPISSIDISPDNKWLAIGQLGTKSGPCISLLNLENNKDLVSVLVQPGEIVEKIIFSADSLKLIYSYTGSQVMIYNIKSKKHEKLDRDNSSVNWITTPDGNKIVVSGIKTQIWNLSKKELVFYIGSNSEIHAIGILNTKGDTLYLAGNDSKIQVFDVHSKKMISTLDEAPSEVQWMSISSDGKYLCVISYNYKGTFLWDLETGKRYLPTDFNEDMDKISCAAFEPSSKFLALGMLSGFVIMIELETMGYVLDEKAHKNKATDICFTKDGKMMFTSSEDGIVLKWGNNNYLNKNI